MALSCFRAGAPPEPGQGLRIGTVRYLPRGVPRRDRDKYFDVWLPLLAPSADLIRWFREKPGDQRRWARFALRYRAEMRRSTDCRQAIRLLALLATRTDITVGCYCEDEASCHRSVLFRLIAEARQG